MTEQAKGLINSAFTMSETELAARKRKRVFIDEWMAKDQSYIKQLKSLTKDQLIHMLITEQVGRIFDEVVEQYEIDENPEEARADLLALGTGLLHGDDQQKLAALTEWESVSLKRAGKNVKKVAEISRIAGEVTARIKVNPQLKVLKKQKQNLAKGPEIAARKRTTKAKNETDTLTQAITDLFDSPSKPGWGMSNVEIVAFLKPRISASNTLIETTVKKRAAEFRKQRRGAAKASLDQ